MLYKVQLFFEQVNPVVRRHAALVTKYLLILTVVVVQTGSIFLILKEEFRVEGASPKSVQFSFAEVECPYV